MQNTQAERVAAHNLQVRLRKIAGVFDSIANDYDFDGRLKSLGKIGWNETLASLDDLSSAFNLPFRTEGRPKLQAVQ